MTTSARMILLLVVGSALYSLASVNGIENISPPAPFDPCANHKCPTGSQCKVYKPTGEAFCEPSCDFDNGGCPANQKCSLAPVMCFRPPCPPVVKCIPPRGCQVGDKFYPVGEVFKHNCQKCACLITGQILCDTATPRCDLETTLSY